MHELSLYGSVPADQHYSLLQDLAGLTCMQPLHVQELHLLFKARQPIGVDRVLAAGSGGSTDTRQQQDFQKLKPMLQHGLFYVKLVGTVRTQHSSSEDTSSASPSNILEVDWTFEFRDTPEVTKQPLNSRSVSHVAVNGGEMINYMTYFGFDYASRYVVEGQKFYTQDTTLFLHRIRSLPRSGFEEAVDVAKLPSIKDLDLLDGSGAYVLQAALEIADGTSAELKDRGARQLTAIRDLLRPVVRLEPADRLALDTRIPLIRKPLQ